MLRQHLAPVRWDEDKVVRGDGDKLFRLGEDWAPKLSADPSPAQRGKVAPKATEGG